MTVNGINNINPSVVSNGTPNEAKTKEVGKDAFLKLLVAQLKNQDPLEPQDQGQFAVDLAQFTQVEQLTEINKKLSEQNGPSGLGLASYLGHEVVLNSTTVDVAGSDGGLLQINPAIPLSSLKVDLMDESGNIVGSKDFANLEAGRQSIAMNNLDVTNGRYSYKITGISASGVPTTLDGKVAGIVSGFIPGPEQTLLVNGKEISMNDIAEVHIAR